MKVRFILWAIGLPLLLNAQSNSETSSLTGLWKGYIISTERRIPYELVINYHDGKFSGFSYTMFGKRDDVATMKRVTVAYENAKLVIADADTLFSSNVTQNDVMQIRQINYLSMDENKLEGNFRTEAPPKFKKAKGTVYLEKQSKKDESKLMAKLDDLNLMQDVTFTLNEPVLTAKAAPVKEMENPESRAITTPHEVAQVDPRLIKQSSETVQNSKPVLEKPVVKAEPAPSKPLPAVVAKAEPAKTAPSKPAATAAARPAPSAAKPASPVATTKPVAAKPAPVKPPAPPTVAVTKPAAPPVVRQNTFSSETIDLGGRKIETIDELEIRSDSLKITLYDNGEVDGDTVSIIMNGKTVVSKQGLTARAFSKILYITPDMGDSVQVVMFAENLGALPPNSGLLVVDYDNRRKEIRFSGDLKKNAAITLKKKRD